MGRLPLFAWLLVAVVAGALTGVALGDRAVALGEVARLFVDVLKLLATPLVFVAIVDTLSTTRLSRKPALVLLPSSTVNAVVAAGLAIGLAHLLPLGRYVDLSRLRAVVARPSAPPPAWVEALLHVLERLLISNLLVVVGCAIACGVLVRAAHDRPTGRALARAAHRIFAGLMRVLSWVVRAVPLAAFCVLARVVGGSGFSILPVLGVFVLVVTLGLALHVFVWYSLVLALVARRSPRQFFRLGGDALGTALSAGSSLATLPVTLQTLEERMNVSGESARLAAVVGTNLNHDGIVLYEAAAALFVAQLYGVDLTLAAQIRVVGASVLAAVGIAGVPDAGLLTLSLVLGRAGLPLSAASLLLPVDWLLGRFRAACNVASDMVVACILERFSAARARDRCER